MSQATLIHDDCLTAMRQMSSDSVDCIVTSPPYYNLIAYADGFSWQSYGLYLAEMTMCFTEATRVLRPNGKLCINTAIAPMTKKQHPQQTRHIKNIGADIEAQLLSKGILERFSFYVWQKQTSKLMFGSYPYPGNLFENNTLEFIHVYVKPGRPPKFTEAQKSGNKMTQKRWLELTKQVWSIYPSDVSRTKGHPAPFPIELPERLIELYTYGKSDNFEGEIVLDMFAGSGTTALAAMKLGRRAICIEKEKAYFDIASKRIAEAQQKMSAA